ncbi:MAG: HD-GYP domain-containing protein [Candidatus Goldbacteria bacterium]|nr:HD-GYP domain-containing protein [Candidatus Goldiibacteriota bacterium]
MADENEIIELKEYIKNLEVINEGLRHSFEELTTLYRLVDIITEAKTLERVLNSLLDLVSEIINCEGSILFLVDDKTGEIDVAMKRNISRKIESKINIQNKKKVIDWAIKKGRTIALPDIEEDIEDSEKVTFVLVPLIAHDKPVGLIDIITDSPEGEITNRDLSLLTILAKQAALAIENVKLYESIKKDQISIIRALASTVDAKDHYTLGHSQKVSEFSVLISEELGLSEREVEIIKYAGLLHDIGKIAMPDDIIKKPARFNEQDFEIAKRHPVIGAKIIKEIESLAPMVPIVLYHHERFDGKGYPDGLKGEDIPLGARIVHVADAYDTMVSARAYRDMLPPELAISELRKNAGTQFDPKIVDTFITSLRKKMVSI